jgi:hypothetical protein
MIKTGFAPIDENRPSSYHSTTSSIAYYLIGDNSRYDTKLIYIFLTNSYYLTNVMNTKVVAISDREVQTLRFLGGRSYA